MNNLTKRILAAAMAFTLIGPGTTVIKKISPQADNTIVANAANYGVRYDYWNFQKPTQGWNYGRYVGQRAGGGIYWIQAALNYGMGAGLNVDGQFGPATEQAVKNFQRTYNRYAGGNLAVDGIFGPNTYSAMQYWLYRYLPSIM